MSEDSDSSVRRTEIAKDASASAHETVAGQSDRRGFLKGVATAAAATLGLSGIAGSVSASRSWGQAYKIAKQHEDAATVSEVLHNQDGLVADIAEKTGLSEDEVSNLADTEVFAAPVAGTDGQVAAVTARKDLGDKTLSIQAHPEEEKAFAVVHSADGETETIANGVGGPCGAYCYDCACQKVTVCPGYLSCNTKWVCECQDSI